jgi:class 3 adenylate cyclase
VVHRTQDPVVNVERGRELAKGIPKARLLEVPGIDHLTYLDDSDQLTDEVAEFLTGMKPTVGGERVLATVLFTDIVDSTKHAEAIGDRRWRELLDAHNSIFRRELARFRGIEIKTLGDVFLATFDGPGRAIHCSLSLISAMRSLGIEIRAGLHTAEVEITKKDVRGIAVHVAARVAAEAKASECLVTRTVKDLVAGADIRFIECGKRDLRGLSDPIDLFAVAPTHCLPTPGVCWWPLADIGPQTIFRSLMERSRHPSSSVFQRLCRKLTLSGHSRVSGLAE